MIWGAPTHTLIPCWMPKPLPPGNQCTGWFAQAAGPLRMRIQGSMQTKGEKRGTHHRLEFRSHTLASKILDEMNKRQIYKGCVLYKPPNLGVTIPKSRGPYHNVVYVSNMLSLIHQHYTKYCIQCHQFYSFCSILIGYRLCSVCVILNTRCEPNITCHFLSKKNLWVLQIYHVAINVTY